MIYAEASQIPDSKGALDIRLADLSRKRFGIEEFMKNTVLVTGSSRGIGHAIALRFAKSGCNLVINGRTETEALHTLCEEINALGSECLICAGDVGNPDFVRSMIVEAEKRFGNIDVLVNNAGISHYGLLSDMTDAEWDRLLAVNLSSAFYCSRSVIPSMVRQQKGAIINISSVWGNCGASCEVAYSATKGGLNSFTKALAKELAPSNISVNAIACGMIDTDMNKCFSSDEIESIVAEIPAGRMGKTDEVADLACNIAFGSSYLTGQIITIDGSWTY